MQKKQSDISQHRRDKNLRILDERQELLDTVREIVRMEIDRQKSGKRFHCTGFLGYLRDIPSKIRSCIHHLIDGNGDST